MSNPIYVLRELRHLLRVVSIGGRGRFLACEDPRVNTQLPVLTSAWVSLSLLTYDVCILIIIPGRRRTGAKRHSHYFLSYI
jgi:hypothetical protein